MQHSVTLFLLFCGSITLYGQNSYWQTGASETAIANSTAAIFDGNVMFHNVGALSRVQHSSISVGYDYRGFIEGLNNISLQYLYKAKKRTFGAAIFKSGDNIYNEFVASIGTGQQLGITSLGIKINYYQNFSEAFGFNRAYSVSAGGVAELFQDFFWGTYIENAFQINSSEGRVHMPVIFATGFTYSPTKNLMLALTGAMDIDEPLQVKSGFSYTVIPEILIRAGVNWYYKQTHYGIGFILKRMIINYAYTPVNNLGSMHSLTLQIKLKEQE